MPQPNVLRVQANGLEHRVLEWEGGSGVATALLLHGFMDAGATWEDVAVPLVARGLRILAPDLRGFGDAPRAPPGSYYHFADYIADVAGLVDSLVGGTPLFLVGHSMGGTIATIYAGTFPTRVTKLALLEGSGPPDNAFDDMPDRMRAWIDQVQQLRSRGGAASGPKAVGTMEDAEKRLAANHPRVGPDVLRKKLPALVRDLGDGRVTWRSDPLHKTISPVPFFARSYRAFASRVTCPVLAVSGGPTGYHAEDEEERLAAFASLERLELEGAGHMMHWTRPTELALGLSRFWRLSARGS